jgi:RNA polymerase sigma factor (sigma-70 family)
MAYVLTSDSAIAEEIVQDAFLKVHASWPRLDNPVGYLRTTVVNGCYSFHRRRAIEQRHAPRVADSTFQTPDELGDALAKLGDRQRVVLALRYYCDLPDAEIARVIGARPSTVRSLIRRALIALHKELEQ